MDKEDLIYRVLSGEATEEEWLELKLWLEEDESCRREYRDIERTWYMGKYAGLWEKEDKNKAWAALESKHRFRLRIRRWRIGGVAAAVMILLGGGVLLFRGEEKTVPVAEVAVPVENDAEGKAILVLSTGKQVTLGETADTIWEKGVGIRMQGDGVSYEQTEGFRQEETVYNELVVPKGGEYKLRLADGTAVHLNSASRLKFPVQFAGGKREVTLEGEGYFDVTADAERPFVVHTSTVDVRVLGTGFNVMAYSGDSRTEVTLVTGRVNVETGVGNTMLCPEQQFVLDNSSGECRVQEVDVSVYVSWKEGIMNFKSMPLEELCERLGRWYDVGFRFTGEDLKRLKCTGAVRRSYDIDYILTMLEAITEVTFQREGKVIRVRR